MRRRVVFGLREVRRGVRAQQVKCLIVAPNVSDGEELQRQITEILDGAAAAKIPVAFALGKRRLGKALRKQSCSVLAIYSDDGAVDEYRAVIKRLDEILLDPSKAVPPGDPVREKKKKPPAPSATAVADAAAVPLAVAVPAKTFGALAADAPVFIPGAWGGP